MNLIALLIIPLLTAIFILVERRPQQVRWLALIGASLQLIAAIMLFIGYRQSVHSNAALLFPGTI
jgi:NADH:ubiquinone oxidoreductase subunit 4 (subunit M)